MKRVLALIAVLFVFACSKDEKIALENHAGDNHNHSHGGNIGLEFVNMVDTNLLYLDTVKYILDNGQNLKVNKYKYYISNIRLIRTDGAFYDEPNSYYLIDQANDASRICQLSNVPPGEYAAVEFLIGVDSLRNVSGSQTGALDIAHAMFWSWSTGYIMAKLEGISLQSPGAQNSVTFHIGGFSGPYSVLKRIHLNHSPVVVSEAYIPQIRIKNDLAEWFKTPVSISFATTFNVANESPASKEIADNYADMFSIISAQ